MAQHVVGMPPVIGRRGVVIAAIRRDGSQERQARRDPAIESQDGQRAEQRHAEHAVRLATTSLQRSRQEFKQRERQHETRPERHHPAQALGGEPTLPLVCYPVAPGRHCGCRHQAKRKRQRVFHKFLSLKPRPQAASNYCNTIAIIVKA
ncbi:hypothetical protein D3C86_1083550 [compost metagenome]